MKRNFIWLPVVGLLLMVVAGYFFPPKHPAPWDFFGSWAVIGFVAYSAVVLSAAPLFRLLARREDYYGEAPAPVVDLDIIARGQAAPQEIKPAKDMLGEADHD